MIKAGLGLIDESMSNLTSTISGETSISSSNARNDHQSSSTTTTTTNADNNAAMLYPQASSTTFGSPPPQLPGQQPPAKKKRGLPGNPDPDAEVIALSPKSLLATNRFICEICNKGFQRDQNLQLHRRGHNLPWKLKQRAKDAVIRKKVYVCPEPSCVHHDPSRALGDLTGIKKHFCRKHGEKKWKCEKCSKKYAVQSDWKAHSKICGTREYRCDCGTLFSRRDSFITHRAFCDALAEESARAINPLSTLPLSSVTLSHHHNHNINNNNSLNIVPGIATSSSLSHFNLPPHLTSHHQQLLHSFPLKREPDHHHHHQQHQHQHGSNVIGVRSDIPPWLACPPPPPPQQQHTMLGGAGGGGGGGAHQQDYHQQSPHMYPFQQHQQPQYEQQGSTHNHNHNHDHNENNNNNNVVGSTLSPFHAPVPPQMSATALLQKAAEMGVTVSNQQQQVALSNTTSCGLTSVNPGFMEQQQEGQAMQEPAMHDAMFMSSFQSPSDPSVSGGFDSSDFGDFHHQAMAASKAHGGSGGGGGNGGGGGGNDGMTRDFLGLRNFTHKDFLNMAGLGHMSPSSTPFEQQHHQQQHDQQQHQNNNQTPW